MDDILNAGGDQSQQNANYPGYKEDSDYMAELWLWFSRCYTLRYQSLDILGGPNIQDWVNQSVVAYSALTGAQDQNNPVVPYSSSIARDKANTFIAAMASRAYAPTVTAQNSQQEEDRVMTRISKPMLEWAYSNDGYPDETGMLKACRATHKRVVEGTVFIQDDVTEEGLSSSIVPLEELFISNFWQPSIEKQPILIRAQLNITYSEAEMQFGGLDRWKYVQRNGGWLQPLFVEYPELKEVFDGIIYDDKATVMYIQKKATHAQLKKLKAQGRVPRENKSAVFYNILVNNVLMYPADNLSPYKDGYYNIKKGIFEPMAKTEFFYGNSLPNKVLEDKNWIDNWKTMMRFLAKQNALRPLQNLGGGDFDDTVYLPAQVTNVDDGVALQKIEGIGDGINQSHVQMYNMAREEIDRGTVSPVSAGQNPDERQTATASSIVEGNARLSMDLYTKEEIYLQEARAVPLLLRLFQFIPRSDIEKISIPHQTLRDGSRGNLEVVFTKLPKLTGTEEEQATQKLQYSMDIRMQEQAAKREKNNKEIVHIDPSYVKDIKFLVKSGAASSSMDAEGQRAQRFERMLPLLLSNPGVFDARAVGRVMLQQAELDDELMAKEGQGGASMPGQQQQMPNQAATPRPGSMKIPQL